MPLLRRAKRLNPRLTVLATPWSPPAWMKAGGSLVGGRLIDEPRYYDAYARYLVKFVRAYRRAGVPIDYLTVQNEPQNRRPGLDSGGNLGDYARGWVLSASTDGVDFRDVKAGAGAGQLTDIDVPRTKARWLRFTLTAAAPNWWSVADVRLYRLP